MYKTRLAVVALLAGLATYCLMAAKPAEPKDERAKAAKTYQQGNYKDAYAVYRKLALDPKCDPMQVGSDLNMGINCLNNLARVDEVDEFREGVIKVHQKNWRLLQAAANTYNGGNHYGYIVAGKFYRGGHRGGGRYVSTYHRDRVRALQLMEKAIPVAMEKAAKPELAQLHFDFATMLIGNYNYYGGQSWRLQYLTDLTKLPDYEDGNQYYGYGNAQGAPVDAQGKPVYHHIPKTYEKAKSDGERWRWLLMQVAEYQPARKNEVQMLFANFLHQQFGEQTMAYYGRAFASSDTKKDDSGTYALHTLKDTETIARLANGIKRFTLPDEFNFIKIYKQVAAAGKSNYGAQARDTLAQTYENRRQYPKAAEAWKTAIKEYGPTGNFDRKRRLEQIVDNWGRIEPVEPQMAGTGATVDFRFRNGKKVSFEAHEIKVATLLNDVKAYLKKNPRQLDWNQTQIGNIGYRLVNQNQVRYLGAKAAAWDLKLKPRPEHFDDRITVETPLKKPGAYLLVAKMDNGNTSRIVLWVNDTILVKKQLNGQVLYYVADAASGKPISQLNVDFFGWRQVWDQKKPRQYDVITKEFAKFTDGEGMVVLDQNKQEQHNYQWLVTASSKQGRLAYLGFSGIWYGNYYDSEYNATKVFTITDRPVYRPAQTVKFKFWIEHAKYDQEGKSAFANRQFTVQINNPKGEKVFEKNLTSDGYGGLAGEFPLDKDVTLGTYSLQVVHHGGSNFRVEEYKKPEFEVKVEAPKEPVRLGEKITATIQAKYYFGSPVTNGKVKYKVMRTSHDSRWYPVGAWDWMYNTGYWWFAYDYNWYPGWREWGCCRPIPIWWGGWSREAPEIVSENTVPLGPDGTVKVEIDTQIAKELHGDTDHKYSITAEVVDDSRRVIVGTGNVLVARKPFKVFAWLNKGHYRAGEVIEANFDAHTLDSKPVEGKGKLTLYAVTYSDGQKPTEKVVNEWKLDTDAQGKARQQLKAAKAGQYRVSYKVTDSKNHTIEGGYVFVVQGEGFTAKDFRFNELEIITDKREYAPGDKAKLLVNTNRAGASVLLFLRPANGVYLKPKLLNLKGKSTLEEVAVIKKDMPNFFIEALTVQNGKVFTEVREVIVPPEKRIINVEVKPSKKEYLPGEKATVKIKLTDFFGKPFIGSTVVSIYDKSVEYISGGSNVPEIKAFFWQWRRSHRVTTESSVQAWSGNILRQHEIGMGDLGVFGAGVVEEQGNGPGGGQFAYGQAKGRGGEGRERLAMDSAPAMAAPSGMPRSPAPAMKAEMADAKGKDSGKQLAAEPPPGNGQAPGIEPSVRKNFADTALWVASIETNQLGEAEVSLNMPENLTGWKVKTWAMGDGTKVGQGEAEVVTRKNIIVRLQAPRFFVEKDEVVLSANVHNYLKVDKKVAVSLEMEGNTMSTLSNDAKRSITIKAGGEQRVDWRVKVTREGQALIRMKAVTDVESDAMQMTFPVYVHGMLKMESFSGVIRPTQETGFVKFKIPAERRVNESRLEVRYSPTLAGAMVDALPYMVDYPYGCTEQTLSRFLPTVITQNILLRMKLDLKDIEKKRVNFNAQEMGDAKDRAKRWQKLDRNPVFDQDEVKRMSKAGLDRLVQMQLSDGGWGWFSGWGEHSYPHTTAYVVHGLQIAKANNLKVDDNVIKRGVSWLKVYQDEQIQLIKRAPGKVWPWKEHADNLDAFIYMVLLDADVTDVQMMNFLYRDRTKLAVYGKAMFGLALHKQKQADKLAMILKNIEQFLVEDKENQSAYLKLPEGNYWWYWYGSDIESNAYYLKLLARTNPKDTRAAGLVKYILNNRKHATYWNSTRDTAVAIEALAEYLVASGEDQPNMTLEVYLDGKKKKEVKIDRTNLFSFDNTFLLTGEDVKTGEHTVELRKKGTGPVYFNTYVTNFTLEDFITKAGLEVKVNRKIYKLVPVDKKIKVSGSRGQALDQKVEKYERKELANQATLKSGDLVEVELEIDSKNDYEYLIFEDMKAAGFEAVETRSGYNGNDMGAFVEFRDNRVCFFIRALARGKHSVSYRLRAEIPGKFSALPAKASAMYAPELKGNSDEIKLAITD